MSRILLRAIKSNKQLRQVVTVSALNRARYRCSKKIPNREYLETILIIYSTKGPNYIFQLGGSRLWMPLSLNHTKVHFEQHFDFLSFDLRLFCPFDPYFHRERGEKNQILFKTREFYWAKVREKGNCFPPSFSMCGKRREVCEARKSEHLSVFAVWFFWFSKSLPRPMLPRRRRGQIEIWLTFSEKTEIHQILYV